MGAEKCVSEIAYENARKNAEYVKYLNGAIKLGRKIMERLGSDASLFLEYELLVGLTEGIYLENVYAVGREDGQKQALKVV